MRENDCSVERLTNTMLGTPADRAPNLELLIDSRSVEAIVGMPLNFPASKKSYDPILLAQYDTA